MKPILRCIGYQMLRITLNYSIVGGGNIRYEDESINWIIVLSLGSLTVLSIWLFKCLETLLRVS